MFTSWWRKLVKLVGSNSGPRRRRRAKSATPRLRTLPTFEQLEDRLVPTTPSVLSINRSLPLGPETNATSVAYAVTFNEPVTGVAAADFLLTTDGSVQAATPVVVAGSGGTYTVTVNGIHGSGDLRLDLIDNDTITSGGVPLGGPGIGNGSFQGQTYNILQAYPSVVSINRTLPAGPATNASSVSFTVTFSEPVTGVNPTDFQVVETGTVGNTLTQVTPVSGSVYTVTVSGITGDGTVGLNLVDNGTIHDLAGNPLVQANAPASFQSQTTYALGAAASVAAVADVNGDGFPDIIVTNKSPKVSVLLANGNGTFQGQMTFAAGPNPYGLAVGDVNGDGKPDLVITSELNNNVEVLLGNGNGTFQSPITYTTGVHPVSVALLDVNGDGNADLVVANTASDSVSILLGNGNGTFQTQTTFAAAAPYCLAVGDLTGDGIPDVVVGDRFTNTVSVLLGNGNGTFQNAATFATGNSPQSIAIADVNGDGVPDLVVANAYLPLPGSGGTVSVLLGNGNGTFQPQRTFATGLDPFSVSVADVNGDGKPDLLVANRGNNNLGVLLGNGNGTFQNLQTLATGVGPVFAAVSDLNGDGRPDVAADNYGSNSVSVLLNATNGNFTGQLYTIESVGPTTHFVVSGTPTGVTAGGGFTFTVTAEDVNNNIASGYTGTVAFSSSDSAATLPGNSTLSAGVGVFTAALKTAGSQTLSATDTVTSSLTGASSPILVTADAATHFAFSGTPSSVSAGTGFIFTVTAEDQFNNTATGYSGTVVLSSTDSLASFVPPSSTLTAGVGTFSATLITAGNETLTATDSVSASLKGTSGPITVTPLGFTHFAVVGVPQPTTSGTSFNFTVEALDPFNNVATSYNSTVHFSSSDTKAALPASGPLVSGEGIFTATLKTAGSQTLTVSGTGNANGTFVQAPGSPINVGAGMVTLAVGDFNSDGLLDVAAATDVGGTVKILLGNGNGTFQSGPTYTVGFNDQGMVTGDFNGDGKLDLALTVYDSGIIEIMMGNGNGTFGAPVTYPVGTNPCALVTGDFNHDGKLDLAVANIGSNTISVLMGNGNGTFQAAVNYAVGSETDALGIGRFQRRRQPGYCGRRPGKQCCQRALGQGGRHLPASRQLRSRSISFRTCRGRLQRRRQARSGCRRLWRLDGQYPFGQRQRHLRSANEHSSRQRSGFRGNRRYQRRRHCRLGRCQ